jgi:hypothetical protein
VALAVGRRAGVDDARPSSSTSIFACSPDPTPPVISTYDAHADAELLDVARGAARGLLGAQLGVAGRGERLVERTLVVADVVGLADGGGVRLGELRDQVLAAHVGRVHADLERANRSIARSAAAVASGRPAPR